MSDKKRPHRKPDPTRNFAALASARRVLQQMALQKGTTVENVRRHIQLEMLVGLADPDPAVQAAWKRIPSAGEVPTPEEVIAYYAEKLSGS